ncbi:MAG: hypothetical protein ABIY55_26095 [Kofleriaceae bacterium]
MPIHSTVKMFAVLAVGLAATPRAGAEPARAPDAGPRLYAPGTISSAADEESFVIMPDAQSAYVVRFGTILVTRRAGASWSAPQIAPFSGTWHDVEPAIAPDGSFLVFASSRPIVEGGAQLDGHWSNDDLRGQGGNLWKVTRTATGWSAPVWLPAAVNRGGSTSIFCPAIARDGSLYFLDQVGGKARLFRSQLRNGSYEVAEPMPFTAGDWGGNDPAVAPDESFLVFSSRRPPARENDLFIVFRDAGQWGTPVHLGERINSRSMDVEPRLGPDGHTLYFASDRTLASTFPRTRAQAQLDLAAGMAWSNGLKNIWEVDLAPWLAAHKHP